MAQAAKAYTKNIPYILGGGSESNAYNIDFLTDTIKIALLNNYTPDQNAHDFFDDVASVQVANGNGYTTGGATLTSKTLTTSSNVATLDAADPEWTTSTITATHSAIYKEVGKKSSVTISNANNTIGVTSHGLTAGTKVMFYGTTAPGGITFGTIYYVSATDLATDTFKISATDGGATIDITSDGSAVNYFLPDASPLICYEDFGASKSSSGGTFTVAFNANGFLTFTC